MLSNFLLTDAFLILALIKGIIPVGTGKLEA